MFLLWGFFKKAQKGYFLCFCFVKRPKRFFPVYLEGVSPKGPSLKSFFSCPTVFFFGFPSVFPFKIPFVSLLFVHQTLFGKHDYLGDFYSVLFMPFSFINVVLVSLKQIFLTSPFLKPKLLSCMVVSFLLVCRFRFCFHDVCFCLSVFMLASLLVCFSFVMVLFLFCFLFCIQTMKNNSVSLQF